MTGIRTSIRTAVPCLTVLALMLSSGCAGMSTSSGSASTGKPKVCGSLARPAQLGASVGEASYTSYKTKVDGKQKKRNASEVRVYRSKADKNTYYVRFCELSDAVSGRRIKVTGVGPDDSGRLIKSSESGGDAYIMAALEPGECLRWSVSVDISSVSKPAKDAGSPKGACDR